MPSTFPPLPAPERLAVGREAVAEMQPLPSPLVLFRPLVTLWHTTTGTVSRVYICFVLGTSVIYKSPLLAPSCRCFLLPHTHQTATSIEHDLLRKYSTTTVNTIRLPNTPNHNASQLQIKASSPSRPPASSSAEDGLRCLPQSMYLL